MDFVSVIKKLVLFGLICGCISDKAPHSKPTLARGNSQRFTCMSSAVCLLGSENRQYFGVPFNNQTVIWDRTIKTVCFPIPWFLKFHFSMKMGPTRCWIDGSWQCGHFGLWICLEKPFVLSQFCWDVGFNFAKLFFIFRSHVPLPGPTTRWTRLVGTIKCWFVPYIPQCFPWNETYSFLSTHVLPFEPITPSYWTVCVDGIVAGQAAWSNKNSNFI